MSVYMGLQGPPWTPPDYFILPGAKKVMLTVMRRTMWPPCSIFAFREVRNQCHEVILLTHDENSIPILPISILQFCKQKLAAPPQGYLQLHAESEVLNAEILPGTGRP